MSKFDTLVSFYKHVTFSEKYTKECIIVDYPINNNDDLANLNNILLSPYDYGVSIYSGDKDLDKNVKLFVGLPRTGICMLFFSTKEYNDFIKNDRYNFDGNYYIFECN